MKKCNQYTFSNEKMFQANKFSKESFIFELNILAKCTGKLLKS